MSEPGAPHLTVRAGARTLALGERPWLMGIVNATPDSFSDAGERRTLDERVALARELLAAGADIVDVGGESGVTNRPAVDAQEEIARVVPLIERIAGELGARGLEDAAIDRHEPLLDVGSADRVPALIDVAGGSPGREGVERAENALLERLHLVNRVDLLL